MAGFRRRCRVDERDGTDRKEYVAGQEPGTEVHRVGGVARRSEFGVGRVVSSRRRPRRGIGIFQHSDRIGTRVIASLLLFSPLFSPPAPKIKRTFRCRCVATRSCSATRPNFFSSVFLPSLASSRGSVFLLPFSAPIRAIRSTAAVVYLIASV